MKNSLNINPLNSSKRKRKRVDLDSSSEMLPDDSLSEEHSFSDSEIEINKKKKSKTDLNACYLLNKEKPRHIVSVLGELKAANNSSKQGSIDVSDRIIMLLKGSKSIKENFFDDIELNINDKFIENLIEHINLNINFREVPDNLFTVRFNSKTKKAHYKYKEAALICRKNLIALIALDKCVINESDMEKVLFETQFSSLNACFGIVKRNIHELRASLIPPFFSAFLKKKLIYADDVGDKFWNIPNVAKKEIMEAAKKEERNNTFVRNNFNQKSNQFFRGQRGGRRNFRGRPFNNQFSPKRRN